MADIATSRPLVELTGRQEEAPAAPLVEVEPTVSDGRDGFAYRLASTDGSTVVPLFHSSSALHVGEELVIPINDAGSARVVVTNVLGLLATVAQLPGPKGGDASAA